MNGRRQALRLCLDPAVVAVIQIFHELLFEVLHRLKLLQIQQLALSSPKKFSITALSRQFPLRLMLCRIPFSRSIHVCRNAVKTAGDEIIVKAPKTKAGDLHLALQEKPQGKRSADRSERPQLTPYGGDPVHCQHGCRHGCRSAGAQSTVDYAGYLHARLRQEQKSSKSDHAEQSGDLILIYLALLASKASRAFFISSPPP